MRQLPLLTPLVAILIILTSSACKKDRPGNGLPAATNYGANTVGCIIDNAVWAPFNKDCYFDRCNKILSHVINGGFVFVFSRVNDEEQSWLSIHNGATKLSSEGDITDSIDVRFSRKEGNEYVYYYYLVKTESKFVVTKYDKLHKTISGEFTFTLRQNATDPKSVVIKSGRFDLKWDACLCD